MYRQHKLKSNGSFRYIYKKGESQADKYFVLLTVSAKGDFKVGLSVGKKVGNAVTRNHLKRLLRASFLTLNDRISKGCNFVIIAKEAAAGLTYQQVLESVSSLLKRSGKLAE